MRKFEPANAWQLLCKVDPQPLIDWLERDHDWSDGKNGVYRVWSSPGELPGELVQPILNRVFACFVDQGRVRADHICLNRIGPGWQHGMHTDTQVSDWITRVHVPVVTNPGAWHAFEEHLERVGVAGRIHFHVGFAYSFDTCRRHDFGNAGDTPRVHLLFDVLRCQN